MITFNLRGLPQPIRSTGLISALVEHYKRIIAVEKHPVSPNILVLDAATGTVIGEVQNLTGEDETNTDPDYAAFRIRQAHTQERKLQMELRTAKEHKKQLIREAVSLKLLTYRDIANLLHQTRQNIRSIAQPSPSELGTTHAKS
nr:MAG TPA: hypothetical protein [Caudoviricetes sp.]